MPHFIGARLAAGLLGAITLNAQAAVVDEQEIHAQLVERIDVRKWGTAIVVGVSSPQGRRVVSYGTLSLKDGRKVDGTTLFEIASLTKVFTALVLADMAKQGKVQPEAPVSTCMPAGVKLPQHGGRQITFVDLATHSSGLPLRPQNLASQTALNKYAGYTLEQLYQGLATFELPRDPGTAFEYSNWGFALLGQALAHCAGKSYEALLAQRVTGPLGMRDTTFAPTTAARSRLASPYDEKLQPMPLRGTGRPRRRRRAVLERRRYARIRRAVPRARPAGAHRRNRDDAGPAAARRWPGHANGSRLARHQEQGRSDDME